MTSTRASLVVPVVGLLVAATLAMPAAAQDTSGWIYVAKDDDIWAVRPDGSDPRAVTSTPDRREADPDISHARGTRLAITYQDIVEGDANNAQGVSVIDLGSGAYTDWSSGTTGDGTERDQSPSWGPDDDWLLYQENTQTINRLELSNGSVTPVDDPPAFMLAGLDSSPDPAAAGAFAYATRQTRGAVIYYQQGSGGRVVVADDRMPRMIQPHFAHDGSYIVFVCNEDRADDDRRGPDSLCRSAPDQPGTGFAVIPTPVEARAPAVSPDGTRLAYMDEFGDVWVAAIDGSNPAKILEGGGSRDFGLDWGPDVALVAASASQPATLVDPPSQAPLPAGGVDTDPATTERADFADPAAFSVAVSAALYSDATSLSSAAAPVQAQLVVLSRDDQFADSLAGSPLTGRGPLLYTPSAALVDVAAAELQRVLPPGATVYLLGGTAALSAAVEQAVTDLGYTPVRLSGPTRFETAATIAREVVRLGGSQTEVLLARGVAPADNPTAAWADSVTGGAYAATAFIPVLVTPTDAVHPAVAAYLDEVGATATLLGGTAALDAGVQAALPGSRRVAGATRADTAAHIATDLLGLPTTAPRTLLLFNGYAADGWTYGLAAAGLAASLHAALAVTDRTSIPPETQNLLGACGPPEVETLLLGWKAAIGDEVATEVDRLDGQTCG